MGLAFFLPSSSFSKTKLAMISRIFVTFVPNFKDETKTYSIFFHFVRPRRWKGQTKLKKAKCWAVHRVRHFLLCLIFGYPSITSNKEGNQQHCFIYEIYLITNLNLKHADESINEHSEPRISLQLTYSKKLLSRYILNLPCKLCAWIDRVKTYVKCSWLNVPCSKLLEKKKKNTDVSTLILLRFQNSV